MTADPKPDPDQCDWNRILDTERTALVHGDLDRLTDMAPEKEKLTGAINLRFRTEMRWFECRKRSSATRSLAEQRR